MARVAMSAGRPADASRVSDVGRANGIGCIEGEVSIEFSSSECQTSGVDTSLGQR